MGTGDGRRRLHVDAVRKSIIGEDPKKTAGADALAAQSHAVGTAIRQWFDAGYDPIELIRYLMVGAIWIADNVGVSREQLSKVCMMVEMKAGVQLVYKPEGD